MYTYLLSSYFNVQGNNLKVINIEYNGLYCLIALCQPLSHQACFCNSIFIVDIFHLDSLFFENFVFDRHTRIQKVEKSLISIITCSLEHKFVLLRFENIEFVILWIQIYSNPINIVNSIISIMISI